MALNPKIGVLALQGAVDLHCPHIEAAGGEFMAVKRPQQFEEIDAFILPGGESTTMLKLIDRFNLWEPLAENFQKKPVWGVCAGTILLAETVLNPAQKSFALLPAIVERNAYGRQIDSHYGSVDRYEVSFIRAPIIQSVKDGVSVRAEADGRPVWVIYNNIMATTFHPETNTAFPSPMHRHFVDFARESA